MCDWRRRFSYVVLVIAVVGALALVQREQTRVTHQAARNCTETQRQWDVDRAQSVVLTQHSVLAPANRYNAALVAQVAAANGRKDRQRVALEQKQGRRPRCD